MALKKKKKRKEDEAHSQVIDIGELQALPLPPQQLSLRCLARPRVRNLVQLAVTDKGGSCGYQSLWFTDTSRD